MQRPLSALLLLAPLAFAVPPTASGQVNSSVNCTLPPGYGLATCGPYNCEVIDNGSNGSYDISNPYITYGCTIVRSGPSYNPAYTPPSYTLAPGDPIAPSTFSAGSGSGPTAAPEISGAGGIAGLTLAVGIVLMTRGRPRSY